MDLELAKRFLQQLDQHENPLYAFRTFSDNKENKNPDLISNRYGHYQDIQDEFVRLNTNGAGIFFTVNRTDGKGYATGNIISVRAVFVDLDGAPLEPVEKFHLKPQIIVESSKGRYHAYWIVDENRPLALPMFTILQSRIAELFHGDKTVKDLPRVMRLPGFFHRKKDPFLTNLVSTLEEPKSYGAEEILDAFGITKAGKQRQLPIAIPQGQRETRLLSFAGSMRRVGGTEESILAALKIENIRCVPPLEISELVRIAHSVSKYEPSTPSGDFVRDKDGKIYPNNQTNIKIALEKMGVILTYDEFSERYLVRHGDKEAEHLEDKTADALWLEIDEAFRFRPSYDFFDKVIKNLCIKHTFHPVKDYFEELRKWDGTPRLEKWLIDYGGAEDSEYVRAVSKIVLIAAVKRILKPGCKFDEMLVLISPKQGTEKSTAIEALCPNEEWFSDSLPLNAESKKVIEQTQGKWIMEAAELAGMRKTEAEHLKSFLSRRMDSARMSYDRYINERARQFIVIGTTNSKEFLKDSTGNRRYWPVIISKFKIAELRRHQDQLWAEALHYEAQGESIRLPERLWPVAGEKQEQQRMMDPWEVNIYECLGEITGRIQLEDVWKIVGVFDRGRRTPADSIRLSQAMHRLGFERAKLRYGDDVKSGYHKGETAEERKNKIIITMDEDNQPIATTAPPSYKTEWEIAAPVAEEK